jgi:hypothetical protein
MNNPKPSGRMMLGSLALLVAVWGILGWFDLPRQATAGFTTDSRNKVTEVASNSPAAEAGLQAGDQITRIGGFAASDSRLLALLPRAKAGDTRQFIIEREDGEHEIRITYAALTGSSLVQQRCLIVLGFCFLLFPLLALFKSASDATRILLFMGIGVSLSVLDGPYTADAGARALAAAISSLFVMIGMAATVQFLLEFPRRRAMLDKSWGKTLVYLPAFLLWLLLAWRLLFAPPATELLNRFSGLFMGLVEGGYFLLALFLLLHNYSKTDRQQRKALALNLMLWGTVLGLVPALIGMLAGAFSPGSHLPGQDYYFMSMLLIPLSWAFAASRR